MIPCRLVTLGTCVIAVAATVAATSCGGSAVRRGSIESAAEAVSGDAVYVADDSGVVHAVDRTGKETWSYALGDVLKRSAPGASHDLVISELSEAPGGLLVVLCYSASGATEGTIYLAAVGSDGSERWHRTIESPTSAARPVAIGDGIYVAGRDGAIRAYSIVDGHDLWTFAVSGAALGSPHVGSGGTIYVRGPRGRVHAIDPAGHELWVFDPH